MSFVYREPAKIVRDILVSEMGLLDSQAMFTNQKFQIPTDGLFLNVSYIGPSKAIATLDEWVDDGKGGLTELQSVTMLHLIQIDIMGFDNTPRTRKEEIIMAIGSIFSQQQQELYNMQISNHPSAFMDTSFLEETKMVTRYTTTVATTSVNMKQKPVKDIYTDFKRVVPPLLTVNP